MLEPQRKAIFNERYRNSQHLHKHWQNKEGKNKETYTLTGKRRHKEGQFEIEIPEVRAVQIPYFVSIVQETFCV